MILRKKRRQPIPEWRDEFIARVVDGKSFADVGGLWGTTNERISVAARAGARSLSMLDISQPTDPLWDLFRERLAQLGLPDCECITADICSFGCAGRKFDVVHCSGVLYHHPNPLSVLEGLRKITARHLVLTSAVNPEVITNRFGTLRVGSSGTLFVPALSGKDKKIFLEYWRRFAGVDLSESMSEQLVGHENAFASWWWLPTAHTMLAMARCAGFRVVDHGPAWNRNALVALLDVVE